MALDVPEEYVPIVGALMEQRGLTWRAITGGNAASLDTFLFRQEVIYLLRRQAVETGLAPYKDSPWAIGRIAKLLKVSPSTVRDAYESVSARIGGYALRATVDHQPERQAA